MKIGIFISPAHPVPPDKDKILAPWILVGELADGLTGRGHEVHLFAAEESKTLAHLHSFGTQPAVRKADTLDPVWYEQFVHEMEQDFFAKMLLKMIQLDIKLLHIHQPIEAFYDQLKSADKSTRFIFTFHDPITPPRFEMLKKIHDLGNCHFVSISNSQRGDAPFPFAATVYHGVPMPLFGFSSEVSPDRFMAVGRIVPEKGFDDAIAAIKATGKRLTIAGQVYEKPEALDYFEKMIKPQIDGKQVFLEPVIAREHLTGHYQTAQALLMPIKWDEPFGMVMIEAMACGTPVIAYNRGSVSEVIKDGVTGFIVEPEEKNTDITDHETNTTDKNDWIIKKKGVEGLIEAIGRIGEIDRAACRRHVEEHFTTERMVEEHEKLYKKITNS